MYYPPPYYAIEMTCTKYMRKRNGWLHDLTKELTNIIDNSTPDNTAKLEVNKPVTLTMETINMKLDTHGALEILKCRIDVRGNISIEGTYFT
jgi:hypothetical protein